MVRLKLGLFITMLVLRLGLSLKRPKRTNEIKPAPFYGAHYCLADTFKSLKPCTLFQCLALLATIPNICFISFYNNWVASQF